MDRYFLDYRSQEIVKNLDTSFLAPEMYIEVIVDSSRDGLYHHTYSDGEGGLLDFAFTMEQVEAAGGYHNLLDMHCKRHGFTPHEIVRKTLYLPQEKFDAAYQGGVL